VIFSECPWGWRVVLLPLARVFGKATSHLWAHGELFAVPFTDSQYKFPAHNCRDVGTMVATASQ